MNLLIGRSIHIDKSSNDQLHRQKHFIQFFFFFQQEYFDPFAIVRIFYAIDSFYFFFLLRPSLFTVSLQRGGIKSSDAGSVDLRCSGERDGGTSGCVTPQGNLDFIAEH